MGVAMITSRAQSFFQTEMLRKRAWVGFKVAWQFVLRSYIDCLEQGLQRPLFCLIVIQTVLKATLE